MKYKQGLAEYKERYERKILGLKVRNFFPLNNYF